MNELFDTDRWSEWCDSSDWRSFLKEKNDLIIGWDPGCILPHRIEACWIFSKDKKEIAFVYGKARGLVHIGVNRYETKENSQLVFFQICRSVAHVSNSATIPFKSVLDHLTKSSVIKEIEKDALDRLTWLSENCRLVSYEDGEFHYVACIPLEMEKFGTREELDARALMSRLVLNHSKYLMKNPVFQLVPSKFFDIDLNTPWELFDHFWSPKVYRPNQDPLGWIWPWQKVEDSTGYRSAGMLTTSLCADIRLSTKAMERTINEVDFARFIRDAVAIMRNCMTKNGGFFDKETGDGVVGHFLDSLDKQNGAMSAFVAAREMSARVAELCKNFVLDSLSQQLPIGLGIGIHTGNAHWFASENQIRAIGSSVVDATRICSGAGPGEVLLSLAAHRNVSECTSPENAKVLGLKKIDFKGMETKVDAYLMDT